MPFKKRSSVTKGRGGKSLRDNQTFKEVTHRLSHLAYEEANLWVDSLLLNSSFRNWIATNDLDNDMIDKQDVMLIESAGSMSGPSKFAMEKDTQADMKGNEVVRPSVGMLSLRKRMRDESNKIVGAISNLEDID
ncbi:hypothetical protein ACFX2K_033319 [Malus domestica]